MNPLKSGTIAIVGRPNVGKSTLINRLIGEKISIVSRKAQTTRHRIMGILTQTDAQYVFVDTPGFQTKHTNALNRTMNRGVTQALAEVDVVILVVEAERFDERDLAVVKLLPAGRPVILAVNKIDQMKERAKLLPILAKLGGQYAFAAIVPISAAKGSQLDDLLGEARKHLPNDELLFGEDEITDKSERFLASEYIREKTVPADRRRVALRGDRRGREVRDRRRTAPHQRGDRRRSSGAQGNRHRQGRRNIEANRLGSAPRHGAAVRRQGLPRSLRQGQIGLERRRALAQEPRLRVNNRQDAEAMHRNKVDGQPAFVLHSYPFRETSLIVEVFRAISAASP